jgi:hypothetical protein
MGFSYSALVSLSDWQLAGEGAPQQLPGKIAHQESFHSISNFHVVFQMQLLFTQEAITNIEKDNKNYCRKIILHYHSIQQICSTKSRPCNCTL